MQKGGAHILERFKRMVWDFACPLYVRRAVRVLSKHLESARGIPEWVDFAYNFHEILRFLKGMRGRFSITPIQIRSEIIKLLQLVEELRARRILEIGTASGGTLFLLARAAASDASLISVDLPEGPEEGGFPNWRTPLYRSFATAEQNIDLIRVNSHEFKTLDEIKAPLKGERLDVLFIDGDHTYKGVVQDFVTYSPLMRNGGLVASTTSCLIIKPDTALTHQSTLAASPNSGVSLRKDIKSSDLCTIRAGMVMALSFFATNDKGDRAFLYKNFSPS